MKKSLLLVLVLAGGIGSCDEERETEVDFLTVNVAELSIHASDFWLFATNEKGEILDVAQYRSGVSFSLSTANSYERIDLTFLQVFEQNGKRTLNLSTHKNIPAGETIELGEINVEAIPANQAGSALITITNYLEKLEPAQQLRFSQAPYGSLPSPISSSGTSYTYALGLTKSPTTMVIHGIKNKRPAYKILSNLSHGDDVVVDFETFQEHQNVVEIKGINGFTFVQGIPGNDVSAAQEILQTDSFVNPEAIYLGTLPGFSRYVMRVYSYADQRDYYRVGSPISSFTFPNYSTTIIDNSLENFQIEIDTDYDYKVINWQGVSGTTNINWGVIAGKSNSLGINLNVPGQITNLYPELRTKQFSPNRVFFYKSNGSFTYSDLLALSFKRQQKLEYEQFTLPAK